MKCRCESSQGMDSGRLRHGTASRTSIFGDCPHLHPKTYRYGYLDKVLSVAEGKERRTFTYHADGQLATATNGKETEDFSLGRPSAHKARLHRVRNPSVVREQSLSASLVRLEKELFPLYLGVKCYGAPSKV